MPIFRAMGAFPGWFRICNTPSMAIQVQAKRRSTRQKPHHAEDRCNCVAGAAHGLHGLQGGIMFGGGF